MNFYQILSHYYDRLFPANPVQMSFIEKFSLPATRFLDLAAGTGNQAILLAKQGYEVTAIDSSDAMVTKMTEKAREENIILDSIRMDMENIHHLSTSTYESIICIGNSLVHLNTIEEMEQMISEIYKMLESNGTFIVQIVNFDRILQEKIEQLPTIEREEGITFKRNYQFDEEKIIFTGTLSVEQNGEQQEYVNAVELIPLQSFQLVSLLQSVGFSEISLFGDFKENEYSPTAPAIIAVAKK